jgi:CelD/BcsL family acetyltransferase involved in cellulose biosynthesis
MLTVVELSSIDELNALEGDWSDLALRCPNATPFQHPGWVLPWYRHFGSGELFVLAVRDEGRLQAVLPLFLHGWEGRRQLTILGTGISDYLDVLFDPEAAADCVAAILAYLAGQRSRWDVCSWQDLPAHSPLLCGLGVRTQAQPCVSLPLGMASLPHGLKRNIRRYTERLTGLGELRFETHCDPGVLSDLFTLHGQRWGEIGEAGVLHEGAVQSFHREAARRLSRVGALRLYRATLDGRAIGVVYGYVWAGTFYSYLGGFDPELKACSPGTVILAYAIQQAIEEGLRNWDFLRGEEPYKFTWGGVVVPKYNLVLE